MPYLAGRNAASSGAGYSVAESPDFLFLSPESDRYTTLLLNFTEKDLRCILQALPGIASDQGIGKHAVVVLSDSDTYYRCISYFYSVNASIPPSAGVYLHGWYGYFVFPFLEMNQAEPTVMHELTHACVAHLPVPL